MLEEENLSRPETSIEEFVPVHDAISFPFVFFLTPFEWFYNNARPVACTKLIATNKMFQFFSITLQLLQLRFLFESVSATGTEVCYL